jgi:hypothetical protein
MRANEQAGARQWLYAFRSESSPTGHTAMLKITMLTLCALFLMAAGSSNAVVNDARFEGCKKTLVNAQKMEVLYAFTWENPAREAHVVVGPTFFKMAFEYKESFAATVSCFLSAGDAKLCANFDVLHWQTGKAVGRFNNCKFKMN